MLSQVNLYAKRNRSLHSPEIPRVKLFNTACTQALWETLVYLTFNQLPNTSSTVETKYFGKQKTFENWTLQRAAQTHPSHNNITSRSRRPNKLQVCICHIGSTQKPLKHILHHFRPVTALLVKRSITLDDENLLQIRPVQSRCLCMVHRPQVQSSQSCTTRYCLSQE